MKIISIALKGKEYAMSFFVTANKVYLKLKNKKQEYF
jgi:hypothetical protein